MLTPQFVRTQFPLSLEDELWIAHTRSTCKKILKKEDERKVLIVGPCSIHDKASALEYAEHFQRLSSQTLRHCFLVMRVYLEKSRSITGWKGLIYDPHLDGSNALETGLLLGREIFSLLTKMRIPIATEFVDPLVGLYLEDLVSWGFVGARTCSSQPHRQFVSNLPFPVGFKNNLKGDVEEAIYGVLAAKHPHTFLCSNQAGHLIQKTSQGNPYAHIVLRGSRSQPNYDLPSVQEALRQLEIHHLPPRLMIDCAHGNSQKEPLKQKIAFHNILGQIVEGNPHIFGIMLESHLKEGNQPFKEGLSPLDHALSITDPCINWEMTEELIHLAEEALTH